MGEGWHNNHHHYQSCARQGFYWWEIDLSYYILRALAWAGLVWDIREPTPKALSAGRIEPPVSARPESDDVSPERERDGES
jgi:stearoyl-CoA desaturase (delta-9 desaturase)